MKRVSYSVETKYKAVEMKAAGFSTKEIMKELNIRNMFSNDKPRRFHNFSPFYTSLLVRHYTKKRYKIKTNMIYFHGTIKLNS